MEENLNEMIFFLNSRFFPIVLEKHYSGVKVRGESKKTQMGTCQFLIKCSDTTMEDEPG